MKFLLGFSRTVDAVTTVIGKSVSWLLLAAVLISATNAVVRKMFDMSSNAWLEVQWYLYGTVFMMAAAYALLKNEHVRIDILSSTWSKRTRVIGPARNAPSVIYAFGHGHLGLTQSAATARLVVQIANGEETSISIDPFRAGRFS